MHYDFYGGCSFVEVSAVFVHGSLNGLDQHARH